MKRRQFVQYSAATALGAFCTGPVGAHAFQQPHIDSLLVRPHLLRFIGDENAILSIGKEYRASYKEEDDVEVLYNRLRKSVGRVSEDGVKRQVSIDFESGEVVCLNGWVLSVTEARQCALFSLHYA